MSRRPVAALLTVLGTVGGVGSIGSVGLSCGDDAPAYRSRAELLDPATCAACHAKHYDEWSASMHAYASRDPVFLAMNRRGQEETSGALGSFCVNCHAPMAVREGATVDGLTWPTCRSTCRASAATFATTSAPSRRRTTTVFGSPTT